MERGIARGLDVDQFAPRLSFFWDIHNDFFEEIAKLRAARRIWARHMKERYGARSPRSWMMRFHSQTAGVTLTAQQPMNNVVRVAYQALAAVLGGTQSLHTNSMDETLALPTEEAVQVALRTQQLLAYETGVPNVIDPLGGSYYLESLTNQLEQEAESLFAEIERVGGVVRGLEHGLVPAQDRRIGGAPAVGDRAAPPRDRRRERIRHRRARADDSAAQEWARKPTDRSASVWRRCVRARQRDACRQALDALRTAAQRHGEYDAATSSNAHGAIARCTRFARRSRVCSVRIGSRSSSDASASRVVGAVLRRQVPARVRTAIHARARST